MNRAIPALFLALVGLAALAIGFGMVQFVLSGPEQQIEALRSEAALTLDRLGQAEAALNAPQPAESKRLAAITETVTDPVARSAELQDVARNAALSSGGMVLGNQALQQQITPSTTRLAVILQVRFSETQLMAALAQIETGPTPFVVDSVTVDSLPSAPDGRNLNVALTLSRLATHAP